MMEKAPVLFSDHGFFSRKGGVSTGVYSSLNCGIGSADLPENVTENRRRVADSLNVDKACLVTPYQVHGASALFVTSATLHMVGAKRHEGNKDDKGAPRPKADGLVTNDPTLAIGVLTADCCPVLLEDRKAGVVGVAHAGWRGAVAGITESVVDLMVRHGARLSDIKAALGPSIHQHSFEVRQDMKEEAFRADKDSDAFFVPEQLLPQRSGTAQNHQTIEQLPEKYFFDLRAYVKARLEKKAISDIFDVAIDTYTSADHFSYRRSCHEKQSDYGRMVSAIRLS